MPRQVVAGSVLHAAAPAVGWYGKTPSAGDFISRRLSRATIDKLDAWLQAGMTVIREEAPDAWQDHYASAPIWNAVLPAGIIASKVCLAVVAASFDRVGRRFPFCVIVALPVRHAALAQFTSLPDYCADLSRLVAESIRTSIDANELDQGLDALTSQYVRDAASEMADLSDIAVILGEAAFEGDQSTVPLSAHSVFPWPDLTRTFDPASATSYWWGNGEPGRLHCGFTHSGDLNARLFATLFGVAMKAEAQARPPG